MNKKITDIVYIEGNIVTLATLESKVVRRLHDTYFYIIDYLDRHSKVYNYYIGGLTGRVLLKKYDLKFEYKVDFLKDNILSVKTDNVLVIEDKQPDLIHFFEINEKLA